MVDLVGLRNAGDLYVGHELVLGRVARDDMCAGTNLSRSFLELPCVLFGEFHDADALFRPT